MTQTQAVKVSINQDSTCCACCGLVILLIICGIFYRYGMPSWIINIILLLIIGFVITYPLYRLHRWQKRRKTKNVYAEYMQREEQRRRQGEQRQWTYEQQTAYGYTHYNTHTQNENVPFVEDNPFTVLGVSEYASETEVKDTYRRLVKEWHPDTFATKGEEVKKVATEKFDEIQKAYEQIKQRRGWK